MHATGAGYWSMYEISETISESTGATVVWGNRGLEVLVAHERSSLRIVKVQYDTPSLADNTVMPVSMFDVESESRLLRYST